MKALLACAIVVMIAASAFAERGVVKLKSGKQYVGEIVDINEKTISIKTATGRRTYPWKVLDKTTIRKYNPGLYDQMLEEARKEKEELIREKGYVQYKGKWMLPEKKKELEMLEKGLAFFENEWRPTNEIARLKLEREMKDKGMVEYKGTWYTPRELEEAKKIDQNKGLKLGISTDEVIAKWGQPTKRKESDEFKSRKREMWFYVNEEEGTEDRLVFEMDSLRDIQTDQPLSD
jgi:hypothetical protein